MHVLGQALVPSLGRISIVIDALFVLDESNAFWSANHFFYLGSVKNTPTPTKIYEIFCNLGIFITLTWFLPVCSPKHFLVLSKTNEKWESNIKNLLVP